VESSAQLVAADAHVGGLHGKLQFAEAGKRTKVPVLWVYGGPNIAELEYGRANYNAFTYQGGRGKFVDTSDDRKSDSSKPPVAEKVDRAIAEYIPGLEMKVLACPVGDKLRCVTFLKYVAKGIGRRFKNWPVRGSLLFRVNAQGEVAMAEDDSGKIRGIMLS